MQNCQATENTRGTKKSLVVALGPPLFNYIWTYGDRASPPPTQEAQSAQFENPASDFKHCVQDVISSWNASSSQKTKERSLVQYLKREFLAGYIYCLIPFPGISLVELADYALRFLVNPKSPKRSVVTGGVEWKSLILVSIDWEYHGRRSGSSVAAASTTTTRSSTSTTPAEGCREVESGGAATTQPRFRQDSSHQPLQSHLSHPWWNWPPCPLQCCPQMVCVFLFLIRIVSYVLLYSWTLDVINCATSFATSHFTTIARSDSLNHKDVPFQIHAASFVCFANYFRTLSFLLPLYFSHYPPPWWYECRLPNCTQDPNLSLTCFFFHLFPRQDVLNQFSMVNLELFNIVEDIKKVSKAFVVHPKNVNAENATSMCLFLPPRCSGT